jgi:zinc protease
MRIADLKAVPLDDGEVLTVYTVRGLNMIRKIKYSAFALLISGLLLFSISAESTNIPGLHRYQLDNGMEVFIFENHAVPLVKIQITFRCGAIAQTAKTAGLFHLYEHMLFKGNKVFKTDSDFQAAMKEIGVTSWNGGTATEAVEYHFTVPADKLAKGVAFWANAVRYPLFKKDELATEKQVVINEIRGGHNDPGRIYEGAMTKAFYYRYPWRRDVSGPEENIRNATRAQLLDIQKHYYIPNNAALFIGGDVDPEAALEVVKTYFSDWKAGPDPWEFELPAHPFLTKDISLVYPSPPMYQGLMSVDMRLRGPDVLADPHDTYAADVWLMLLEDPNGKFKNDIYKKVKGIYKKEYIDASYFTQRDGAVIYFRTYLVVDPAGNSAEHVEAFKAAVLDEMKKILDDPDYFSKQDFDLVKTRLEDKQLLDMQTADQLISSLAFWWSSADTDYYLHYIANMKKITIDDVKAYIRKYISGRHILTGVQMNPGDYQKEKGRFSKDGYTEIKKENAFWWSNLEKGGTK